jgi:His-Xaa-Ser system radical SAM maturase HxsB
MAQETKYLIFPFTFRRMPDQQLLLVNQTGEFIFISSEDFSLFVNEALDNASLPFLDLKSKHFVTDTGEETPVRLLATKLRTKKGFLKNFTALHMIVITTRCNFRCDYCHASSSSHQDKSGDMSWDTALKVVNMIFRSSSPTIKIEFQGGEPILNWRVVQKIIEYALFLNRHRHKNLEFVLCTNLTLIEESILKFLKKHRVLISTSLDGPKELHDLHRVSRTGISGYNVFKDKLELSRSFVGRENVSALLTVTKSTLEQWKQVIDEYLALGFNDIFIRSINPYGRARTESGNIGYPVEEFVNAYKQMLEYILKLNLEGIRFIEHYASLLLYRILTPFSTGFMDLQSPSGAGISGAIYDYNGDVYPSDEARMLARMGDKTFCMGNVHTNGYEDIFNGPLIHKITHSSCVETLPECASCAFQMYCGADPIRNYVETGDIVGHRPTSEFCKKNMEIIDYLFEIIRENDEKVIDVFWSWITNRSLKEIRG